MKKTSYFSYAKLNPTEDDELKIDNFCRTTQSYTLYSIDQIRPDVYLLEGVIVFSKKITIFEASTILTGFTVQFLEDFGTKANEILENEVIRSINKHPAASVKIHLETLFETTFDAKDEESQASMW